MGWGADWHRSIRKKKCARGVVNQPFTKGSTVILFGYLAPPHEITDLYWNDEISTTNVVIVTVSDILMTVGSHFS